MEDLDEVIGLDVFLDVVDVDMTEAAAMEFAQVHDGSHHSPDHRHDPDPDMRLAHSPDVLPEALDSFPEDEDDQDDTTAEHLAAGRDIQGIPWDRLHFSREQYRETRLKQYHNYANILQQNSTEGKVQLARCCNPRKDGCFFKFVRNNRGVHTNIMHFQLRNLVWATSRNDIFVVHENSVDHWNPVTRKVTQVMNLAGGTRGTRIPGVGRVQVSTLCVKEGIIAAGGFGGELVCKCLDSEGLMYSGRVTNSDNGITNGIEVFDSLHHGKCVMTSNNDAMLRIFTAETFKAMARFPFPWAVNFATIRPDSSVVAVVGDDPTTHLIDIHNGVTVAKLSAHMDYSFAAAWHPNGNFLATGNQDMTTAVWDIRCTSEPLVLLAGRMGAIRSLRFSPDGRFLAMSEPADFVHIYDTAHGFSQCMEIDLFGEIAGISFTPYSDAFFVGVADVTYSSILHYDRYSDNRFTQGLGWRPDII